MCESLSYSFAVQLTDFFHSPIGQIARYMDDRLCQYGARDHKMYTLIEYNVSRYERHSSWRLDPQDSWLWTLPKSHQRSMASTTTYR